MEAAPVGAGVGADVGRGRAHLEPTVRQRVLEAERQREGIARLGVEHVLQHDAVRLALGEAPRAPAHETVDGVSGLGLGQWELMAPAPELVAAVLEPVRPRHEHLAATRGAHLVRVVAVEDVSTGDRIRPQPAADLDDDGALVAVDELVLLPARWDRPGAHGVGPHQNPSPTSVTSATPWTTPAE